MDDKSTICAISTPHGVGGIAVIRVSGPDAIAITDRVWGGKPLVQSQTHTAHYGTVFDTDGRELDQTVATVYRAPRSFTGEDTVEIAVHGSTWIQAELIESLTQAGARLAQPGEFTRRAFVNGKLGLTQAEAVADMIAADSRAAHAVAMQQLKGKFANNLDRLRSQLTDLAALLELELDFSEEDVEFASRQRLIDIAAQCADEVARLHRSFRTGEAIRNGIRVAIIGPTNAGKSSLLNQLLGYDRAIVSDIHGTTRDTVEETATIGEFKFRFIDTAGQRQTDDPVEQLGIKRSQNAADQADIVIRLHDTTHPGGADEDATYSADTLDVYNKTDLHAAPTGAIAISALTGHNIDTLRTALAQLAARQCSSAGPTDAIVTNARHAAALAEALDALTRTLDALRTDLPGDLIAQDLRAALSALSTLTGAITTPTILSHIFTRFCIGK